MFPADPTDDAVRHDVLSAFGPFDLWDADDLAARLALPRSTVARGREEHRVSKNAIEGLVRDGFLRCHADGYAAVGAEIA